jgi:hypothetical protein
MKIKKIKCVTCGEDNKRVLDAHHVIPRTDPRSTDLADNLIPVCSNCHRKIHAGDIIIEGRFPTSKGPIWFWHYPGKPYTIRPGIFLQADGTAKIVEG